LVTPAPQALAQTSPSPAPSATPSATAECVGCHSNPAVLATTVESHPGLLVGLDQIAASAHSDFTCTMCHSGLTGTMHAKLDAARDSCAGCHTEEAALMAEGAHGDPERGSKLSCVSCHGNHRIRDTSSEEFRLQMTEKCSSCHAQMNERFSGGNPFGMETHLGRADVATCWDCHRAHKVQYVSDPDSPVHPTNILATCQECHVGAPPNFADIQIHVASSPLPEDRRLRAVTLYMLFLLVFTFGFFGYHTYLQIQHERRRRAAGGGRRGSVGGVL
jgi:hypothetical protein